MNSELEIRLGCPADATEIATVQEAAFRGVRKIYRPKPTARPISAAQGLDVSTVIAKCGEVIVGVLNYWNEAAVCHLGNVAVDPKFRRQGIARRLIAFLEGTVKSENIETISAKTIRETGNVQIYQRLGFEVANEELATWCESDLYEVLHEVTMVKPA